MTLHLLHLNFICSPRKLLERLLLSFTFYMCIHICVPVFFVCLAYVPVPTEAGKPGVGSPATGFIGACEPPCVGAGDQLGVLWKNNIRSAPNMRKSP